MRSCWSNPYLLLLAPLYGAALWAWWRRQHSLALAFRRRTATKALLHAAAALSLLLAAAGLQVPAHASRQTVVAVADVSASVFDLSTQSARLSEALAALDPQAAQAAIVIFGRTAGLERALSPLARDQRGRTAASPTAGDWYLSPPGAVDLARPATIVDRSATDIGSALNFARGLFPAESGPTARAILLLSDFRDTCGSAGAAAAALSGSGIDLLACPAALGPSADVRIDALNVPLAGRLGRDLPVEVTVAAQSPATVRVAVWKKGSGAEDTPVDFKTIALAAEPGAARTEIRRQVRVLDRPASPGVAVYTARVSAAEGELPGDITLNNELSAAVRITGVSRWAVLTRAGSTLAQLCADKAQPLGVEAAMFTTADLPRHVAAYDSYAGILVDGLSAAELPEGPALRALAGAVDNGKALVALGGEQAFGAGGHREGAWEQLLPVEMTPEDDRTRAVLFIMDVSKSMEERMGRDRSGVRKIDFASEQLALAVQKLRPPDRLGMIAFSGAAELVAPLSAEPGRSAFLAAVKNLAILSNTDLVPALRQARVVLNADNAEEQLVVLLSDGVQTVPRPEAEILQAAKDLCPLPQDPAKPRRPVLCTFGIDVDAKDADPAGEKLLKGLAAAGGGKYFPEFLKLGERLEQALIGAKKDFYVRREPFVMRPAYQHPLLAAAGIPLTPPSPQRGEGRVRGGQEAVLPFRNRVKAKPAAEVLLWSVSAGGSASVPAGGSASVPAGGSASVPAGTEAGATGLRPPDPILVLSGPGWSSLSRRAVLAAALDGNAGSAWLSSAECRKLLPALLEWAEAKTEASVPGWEVDVDAANDDALGLEVRARDPASGLPINGRKLSASLTALQSASLQPGSSVQNAMPLHPSAPGTYRALIPTPPQGVYRLNIQESSPALPSSVSSVPSVFRVPVPVCERFVTVPYPAELRRFGTDRAAMQQLVAKAGGDSRVLEDPRDIARWVADKAASRESYSLRPWLIALGVLLLLIEYGLRGARGKG